MARDKYGEAYCGGKADRNADYTRSSNPYPEGSSNAQAWDMGWAEEDKKLKSQGDAAEPMRTIRH